jgi:hypothetical protein
VKTQKILTLNSNLKIKGTRSGEKKNHILGVKLKSQRYSSKPKASSKENKSQLCCITSFHVSI